MAIKHAHQTSLPNDSTKDVSADAWNEAHSVSPAEWKDDNLDISTLATGLLDNPDIIAFNETGIEVPAFAGASPPAGGVEQVCSCREIQHDYKEGTDITPHIHWYPTTTDAGNVVWQLEYLIVRGGVIVGGSTTITVTQAAGGTAWLQKRADWTAIDGADLKIGDQIHFRLFRDYTHESDTYEFDAAVATFGFHYQVDSLGSASIVTK